jgi:glutamate racemase
VTAEAPIGVLAAGGAGLVACDALSRVMPKEDLVLMADTAYAPYARRPGRVVADRVTRLADELAGMGVKLIVLASAQGAMDALDAVRARVAVPVLGPERLVAEATARAGGRPAAVITGAGCVRGLQYGRGLRRERGGAGVIWDGWPDLRETVEAGRPVDPAAVEARIEALRRNGVAAVMLACPHAGAIAADIRRAAPDMAVVDGSDVVAARAKQLLLRAGLLARRKRPGRRVVLSSDPAAAQRVLAARR